MNRERAEQILELRKNGCSVGTIAKKLGAKKGIVAYWVRKHRVPLSEETRAIFRRNSKLGLKAIRVKWQKFRDGAEREAQVEWPTISKDASFMLGLGLYWGEGSKTTKTLILANADLSAIRIFRQWAEKFLGITKWVCRFSVGDVAKSAAVRTLIEKEVGSGLAFAKGPRIRTVSGVFERDYGCVDLRARNSTRAHYKVMAWLSLLK